MNYYNRKGKPLSMEEWGKLHADQDYQQLARTVLEGRSLLSGDIIVSTVWLGLDHSFGHGEPMIFETMIFGGIFDEKCWRYSTEEDAMIGHWEAVKLVKEES